MKNNSATSFTALIILLMGGYIFYQKQTIKRIKRISQLQNEYQINDESEQANTEDYQQNNKNLNNFIGKQAIIKDSRTNKAVPLNKHLDKERKKYLEIAKKREEKTLKDFHKKTGINLPYRKDLISKEIENSFSGVETFLSKHSSGAQVKYIISKHPLTTDSAINEAKSFIPIDLERTEIITNHNISHSRLKELKLYYSTTSKDSGIYVIHAKVTRSDKEFVFALQDVPKESSILDQVASTIKKIHISI